MHEQRVRFNRDIIEDADDYHPRWWLAARGELGTLIAQDRRLFYPCAVRLESGKVIGCLPKEFDVVE